MTDGIGSTVAQTSAAVPVLTVQAGSLWSSGTGSFFTGTGGPAAYDPFLGGFSAVVSSAGLDATPFQDQLWNVAAGEEVVFVVAVQNRSGAPVFDLALRDIMPAGFDIPPEGSGLTVMDGTGSALNVAGDPLAAGGMTLLDPLPAYDPASGTNVLLITFTLKATGALPAPAANLLDTATVTKYATVAGGANALTAPVVASTPVATPTIRVESAADQTAQTLNSGERASYDVTLTLPEGTVRDLRIDEILPKSGQSWLHLVSAQVIRVGANLQTAPAPVIGTDGSIAFGDVTDLPDGVETDADRIVLRLTVEGAGTTAGLGTLQTQVSAVDPNSAGGRWTSSVTNTIGLATPNTPPTIAGTQAGQSVTNLTPAHPFASLALADPDLGQAETLTFHLSQPLLGTLGGSGLSTTTGGDYVLAGTIDQVQAEARALVFATSAGGSGLELISLALRDSAGALATDAGTEITVASIAPNVAPTIAGAHPGAAGAAAMLPFDGVVLTDPDQGQTQTLTIHLSQPLLGTLSGAGLWTTNGTDYVLSGPVDQVQAAIRATTFTKETGRCGTEVMTLTLDDGAGGVATDAATVLNVDVPPTIAGTSGGQFATNTMQVRPFAAISLADPDQGQRESLTITLSQPGLGKLSGDGLWTPNGTDYYVSGSIDALQTVAQNIVFTPTTGGAGIEALSLTLDDASGGVMKDAATQVNVVASAPQAASVQHFPVAPTGSVTISTANGSSTMAQVETYGGPVTYLQGQFIYDGTAPLAIAAKTPNMFIKNVAGSTAVQLLSGQNVVDAGHGSNFLLGGTGTDVFFLDGRQLAETWDTIVGFHSGDFATLFGFKQGVSHYWWEDKAGVGAYTGRTLHADLTGSGHVDASLTFASTTAQDTSKYDVTFGTVGGNDYMLIHAP